MILGVSEASFLYFLSSFLEWKKGGGEGFSVLFLICCWEER